MSATPTTALVVKLVAKPDTQDQVGAFQFAVDDVGQTALAATSDVGVGQHDHARHAR